MSPELKDALAELRDIVVKTVKETAEALESFETPPVSSESKETTNEPTLEELYNKLSTMVAGWQKDGSHPANYIRNDGVGNEIARVDRWCGGFQDAHKPVTIGWRAHKSNQHEHGIVKVAVDRTYNAGPYGKQDREDTTNEAIDLAMERADNALRKLGWKV